MSINSLNHLKSILLIDDYWNNRVIFFANNDVTQSLDDDCIIQFNMTSNLLKCFLIFLYEYFKQIILANTKEVEESQDLDIYLIKHAQAMFIFEIVFGKDCLETKWTDKLASYQTEVDVRN